MKNLRVIKIDAIVYFCYSLKFLQKFFKSFYWEIAEQNFNITSG